MGADPLTIGLYAVAAISTASSMKESAEARSASRKAEKARERMRERKAQQEKLANIRQGQIARADILAQGAGQGVVDSSGVQGAVSSLDQTIANNLAFIQQMDDMSNNVADLTQKAQKHAGNAQVASGVASLAMASTNLFPSGSTTTTKTAGNQSAPVGSSSPHGANTWEQY